VASFDKQTVLDALRAEDVAAHYDLCGAWRGRWMRSRRCAQADHASDAFGLARDGMWHCWSCDTGGDLIKLVALAEKLDIRADFSRVLEIAAGIAGIVADDDFGGGKPAPRKREPIPELPPIAERLAMATKRASWLWSRLRPLDRVGAAYARSRGIDLAEVMNGEELTSTPTIIDRTNAKCTPGSDLERLANLFGPFGVCLPVRALTDGRLLDVRVRRIEPKKNEHGEQPKIVGMLGGVIREGHTLYACYGHPNRIRSESVIVVEGIFDYLTARMLWPKSDVLGATDAGSYPYVALHAARTLKLAGGGSVVLVAQRDQPLDDAAWRANTDPKKNGAADMAVCEATKHVISVLGTRSCSWVECGPKHHDLNEAHVARSPIQILSLPPAYEDDEFGGK
jgi:hypothetical protein